MLNTFIWLPLCLKLCQRNLSRPRDGAAGQSKFALQKEKLVETTDVVVSSLSPLSKLVTHTMAQQLCVTGM